MPPITALLHTANDARRLGRTLETLLPCSEILVVDHRSTDATRRIARQYGARIVEASQDQPANYYLVLAVHEWILCLQPSESITEGLQASLFEWSALAEDEPRGKSFSIFVQEQGADGRWRDLPQPETRLVSRGWTRWQGNLPVQQPSAIPLEGKMLRFVFP